MADNTLTGANVPVATRSVTYSGDAGQNAQAVGIVAFSGSDDAKTATDIPGDATNGLDVDVTRMPRVSGSGSLTATSQAVTLTLTGQANTTFQLTGTWSATVTFEASNDNTNWSSIYAFKAGDGSIAPSSTVTDSANNDIYRCTTAGFGYVRARCSAYTSGTIVVTAFADSVTSGVFINFPLPVGSNTIGAVTGSVAHDGIDSGNPMKIGMKAIAHGSNPTAVAAADRTDWYANRHGIPWMIGGHPNVITVSARITGSNTDVALAPTTVNAGTKVVVTRLTVAISNATTVNVGVRIGFGATTLAADSTTGATGILVDSDGFPPGGGANLGSGSGILGVGGDGEELRITNDAPTSGTIHVSYSYYTIES